MLLNSINSFRSEMMQIPQSTSSVSAKFNTIGNNDFEYSEAEKEMSSFLDEAYENCHNYMKE